MTYSLAVSLVFYTCWPSPGNMLGNLHIRINLLQDLHDEILRINFS